MYQEIASAINQAVFQMKAPAYSRIMNAKSNVKGAMTAITHQNTIAVMALVFRNIIINQVQKVNKGVIDFETNYSLESLMVYAAALVRFIGICKEGTQIMWCKIHAVNKWVVIPVQVWWQTNPLSIRE